MHTYIDPFKEPLTFNCIIVITIMLLLLLPLPPRYQYVELYCRPFSSLRRA